MKTNPVLLGVLALSVFSASHAATEKKTSLVCKKNKEKNNNLNLLVSSGNKPLFQASIPVLNSTSIQANESNAKNATKNSNLCFFVALSGSITKSLDIERSNSFTAPVQKDIEQLKNELAQQRIGKTERDQLLQKADFENQSNKAFSNYVDAYEDSVRSSYMPTAGVMLGVGCTFSSNIVLTLRNHFLFSFLNDKFSGALYTKPELTLGYEFQAVQSLKITPFLSTNVLAKITSEEKTTVSSKFQNSHSLVAQIGAGVRVAYKEFFAEISGQVDLNKSVLLQPENQKKFASTRFASMSFDLGYSW